LNEQGKVYAFGKGSHGRLGIGKMPGYKDVDQAHDVTDDDSTLIPPLDQPQMLTAEALRQKQVIKVAAGCRHSAALSSEGQLYCWGFNFYE